MESRDLGKTSTRLAQPTTHFRALFPSIQFLAYMSRLPRLLALLRSDRPFGSPLSSFSSAYQETASNCAENDDDGVYSVRPQRGRGRAGTGEGREGGLWKTVGRCLAQCDARDTIKKQFTFVISPRDRPSKRHRLQAREKCN